MKGSKGVGGCACIAWITATCCAWLRHIVAGERAEQWVFGALAGASGCATSLSQPPSRSSLRTHAHTRSLPVRLLVLLPQAWPFTATHALH